MTPPPQTDARPVSEPDPLAEPATIPDYVPLPDQWAARAPDLVRNPRFHRLFQIIARVSVGVMRDGFTHAGNLAYLTLMALFPFFIVVAALATLIGRGQDSERAISTLLNALPPNVEAVLRGPIADVLGARTGDLLWLGGLVGLWTAATLIEAIRDMLRAAYGAQATVSFWKYRLMSVGIILVAVILLMLAFSAQVTVTAGFHLALALFPKAAQIPTWFALSRVVQVIVLWLSIYFVIWTLTPSRFRIAPVPKWPGPLFTALWWQAGLMLLPFFFTHVASYGLTYGSLAGVVVALLFFWYVGLGLVIGAYLNAALIAPPARDQILV